MMLWQAKAGARCMYYFLNLVWLLELILPSPLLARSLSLSLSQAPLKLICTHCIVPV